MEDRRVSARRQARATKAESAVVTVGGVPRCLALGPCLEVWAAVGVVGIDGRPRSSRDVAVICSARWRYSAVRRWWVAQTGMDERKSWQTLPAGRAWSIEAADSNGRSRDTDARLRAIGCTRHDLPTLADEAQELHSRAAPDDPRHDSPHRPLRGKRCASTAENLASLGD
jgi:hypothetical protein